MQKEKPICSAKPAEQQALCPLAVSGNSALKG